MKVYLLSYGQGLWEGLLMVSLVLTVLDLAAWRIVSAFFDRERLLTRYGGP